MIREGCEDTASVKGVKTLHSKMVSKHCIREVCEEHCIRKVCENTGRKFDEQKTLRNS